MIGFNKASEVFILKTSEKPKGFGLRHANQRLYYNILIAEIQGFDFKNDQKQVTYLPYKHIKRRDQPSQNLKSAPISRLSALFVRFHQNPPHCFYVLNSLINNNLLTVLYTLARFYCTLWQNRIINFTYLRILYGFKAQIDDFLPSSQSRRMIICKRKNLADLGFMNAQGFSAI